MQLNIDGPAGGRGKWSKPGVPKRGWVCVGENDLGSLSGTCQMCEDKDIRYVHYMWHKDYPDTLECGCVCSGHMEENTSSALERERAMKNAARRRDAWPDRAGWYVSKRGHWTIEHGNCRMTVFEKNKSYKVSVKKYAWDGPIYGVKNFDALRQAKMAALDAYIWAQRR